VEEIHDGMDISICCFFPDEMRLEWAGAHNPLWVIRDGSLIELKGDWKSVGQNENAQHFSHHEIKIQEGDTLYVFSDGYADQLDPDTRKRLTTQGLKNILLSFQNMPMSQQSQELKLLHNKRKGNKDQTDDICLIGIRF